MDLSKYIAMKQLQKNRSERRLEEQLSLLYKSHPDLKRLRDLYYEAKLESALDTLYGRDASLTEKKAADLREKWESTLNLHGLTEDIFTPEYLCDVCKDTGFHEEKICRCIKRMAAEDLKREYALSEMLKTQNFSKFDLNHFSGNKDISVGEKKYSQRELMEINLERAKRFTASFPNGTSLLFFGGTGVGKTFLVNCIADHLIREGFEVVYYRHVSLEILLNDRMSYQKNEETEARYRSLQSADLLIIDDLGAPRFDSLAAALFEIIDQRQSANRSVIITTNMSSSEIAEFLGERFHSRLFQYTTFRFLGKDTRTRRNLPNQE